MTLPSLQLDYVSSSDLASRPTTWWDHVLGVVGFARPPSLDVVDVPVTASMTPALGDHGDLCEVWRVAGNGGLEPSAGTLSHGRIQFRCCDEFMFGALFLNEHAFDGNDAEALLHATRTAYREVFASLEETRHHHLVRVWNYLPEINAEVGGDERYRHFNSARQSAFRESGRSTVGSLPAACALGSPAGSPLSIYFLASRHPPRMIENPRQISAYHYPPKFGVHSPIFSRACVLSEAGGTNLFVSGTASIVGYETVHHGDVAAQTRESLTNIEVLLDEANRVMGSAHYSMEGLKFKVYVRRASDLAAIERALSSRLPETTSIVYLQADVCREDLLVEIEATGDSGCRSD